MGTMIVALLAMVTTIALVVIIFREGKAKTKKPAKYRIRPKYYGEKIGNYYLQKKKWYGWNTPLDEWGECYLMPPGYQNYREELMKIARNLEAKNQNERDKKDYFYFDVTTTEKTDEV